MFVVIILEAKIGCNHAAIAYFLEMKKRNNASVTQAASKYGYTTFVLTHGVPDLIDKQDHLKEKELYYYK